MRILQRYILRDYAIGFLMTLTIFTFVMCIGVIIKAIDAAAQGISLAFMTKLFLLNIPYLLTFSIPISVLTACLLLFGRLSFDGELTAMKACGMSLWNVMAPVVIASVLFSGLCLYINNTIAPLYKEQSRVLLRTIGFEQPMNLLEPGRFIQDFPNLMVYVESRDGSAVEDVVVYERDAQGVARKVMAQRGELRSENGHKVLHIDLYGVRIEQRDAGSPDEPGKTRYINADYYPVRIDLSTQQQQGPGKKKPKDMPMAELIERVRDVKKAFPDLEANDLARQKMFMIVEVNKRFSMALSCFAFTLIGIPLGIKSRRKESSVGIGIALALVFFFYLFTIIANSLVSSPAFRPDLIVWVPVIACELIGFYLIYRQN